MRWTINLFDKTDKPVQTESEKNKWRGLLRRLGKNAGIVSVFLTLAMVVIAFSLIKPSIPNAKADAAQESPETETAQPDVTATPVLNTTSIPETPNTGSATPIVTATIQPTPAAVKGETGDMRGYVPWDQISPDQQKMLKEIYPPEDLDLLFKPRRFVIMPNVVGMTKDAAAAKLRSVGIVPRIAYANSKDVIPWDKRTFGEGICFLQDGTPGEKWNTDASIHIYIQKSNNTASPSPEATIAPTSTASPAPMETVPPEPTETVAAPDPTTDASEEPASTETTTTPAA